MINEELKTFISKMRTAGKTDSETAAELKTVGWAEADITLALNPQPVLTVDSQSLARPDLQEEKIKTESHRSTWIWITVIAIAFLVGGYLTLRILPNLLVKSLKNKETSVIYPRSTSSPPSLVPSAISQTQVEQEPNWDSLDFKGLSIKIPSDWQEKPNEGGKLFVSQDGKAILAVALEGKQCFPTLKDYVNGVKKIASSEENFVILGGPEEKVVNGITTYRILIGTTHGDRQVITNSMLFKGEINNFGVVIGIDSSGEKYLPLTTKVFDSVRINDSSEPITKNCSN